jgi:tetratricopeptide (TPR) repeat protein
MLNRMGDHPAALAAARRAVSLKPEMAEAHRNLGVAYGFGGRWDLALAEFQETLRLKPDFAFAHYNIGWAYFSTKRYAEAIGPLTEAVRLNPDYTEAHHNLAYAYLRTGDREAALKEYRILRKLSPALAGKLYRQIKRG